MEHEGQKKEKTEEPKEAMPRVFMSGFCKPLRKTCLPFQTDEFFPHPGAAVVSGVLSLPHFQLKFSHFLKNCMPDRKEAAGSWIPCHGIVWGKLQYLVAFFMCLSWPSSAGNKVNASKTTEDGKFNPSSLLGYLPTKHCIGDLTSPVDVCSFHSW